VKINCGSYTENLTGSLLLANKLIKAVPPGAHLLLVGDVDQLPSVGAGEVLRDLLAEGTPIPHVRLTGLP